MGTAFVHQRTGTLPESQSGSTVHVHSPRVSMMMWILTTTFACIGGECPWESFKTSCTTGGCIQFNYICTAHLTIVLSHGAWHMEQQLRGKGKLPCVS